MRRVAGARPIICAIEDGEKSSDASRAASWLAREADAPLILAHVSDPTQAVHDDAHQMVEAMGRTMTGVDFTTELPEGEPVVELQRLAAKRRASLLVTGAAAESGLDRILIGSVASKLAAEAPCPLIAVARGSALEEPGPVLAGYDGSDHSMRAARHAAALAARLGRDLVLLHVVAPGSDDGVRPDAKLAHELHAAGVSALGDESDRPGLDLKVSLAVEEGDPVRVLGAVARERAAALIFTGTRGRNALSAALLGSVSTGLVRAAGRPVGLVPSSAGSAPPR
jgi:nucleotide-binding universal stress UspA family protein